MLAKTKRGVFMDTKNCTLYGLALKSEPWNIRYIGITTQKPERRFSGHKHDAIHNKKRNLPVHNWMRKHGVENVGMFIIRTTDDLDYVKFLEQVYIENLREHGFDLLNLTEGGDGVVGCKFSEEELERRRIAMTGENNPLWGKKRPEVGVNNQKLKTGKPGYWAGRPRSEETRQKLREKISGRTGIRKITDDEVRGMRQMFREGVMQTEIAKYYDVAKSTVNSIVNYRKRKDVE